MKNPCQCGLKCPHHGFDDCGDEICIHPYTDEDFKRDTEGKLDNETFGLVDEMDCPIMIVGSTMDLFLKTLDEYDETQTFATLHSMMDDGLAPCMICGERRELTDATVNDSNGEPMELTINGFNSKSFAICVDCMETFLELVDDLTHEKEGEE